MSRYDPDRHHRRSIRLRGYDYTRVGAYFVTIVTQERVGLFGDIDDGVMYPNAAGHMVRGVWEAIPRHYLGVAVDAFVLMPNHIHGIILLTAIPGDPLPDGRTYPEPVGAAPRGRPMGGGDDRTGQAQGPAPTAGVRLMSLADVVHRFKTMTTRRYANGVINAGWPAFPVRLWQRNYFEHVIRDEAAFETNFRIHRQQPGTLG